MTDTSGENLAQYVRRIMKLKGLTQKDVQQRSGGEITDGYVASILIGRAKNPSVDKLLALARGLDVDPLELFHIACGLPKRQAKNQADALTILEVMKILIVSSELIELLQELARMPAKEQKSAIASFQKIIASRKKSEPNNSH